MKTKQPNPTQVRKDEQRQALAQKLDAMLEPEPVQIGKPFYEDFASYAADYPEGAGLGRWLTKDGYLASAFLLLLRERQAHYNTLPGHYMAASVQLNSFGKNRDGTPKQWVQFTLHDIDDGYYIRTWEGTDASEALKLYAEMKEMAPFSMKDVFDYFQFKPA